MWAFALERTTPTRVAISVTVNPVAASLVGATLLGEPLRWNLAAGIVTVVIGIWIATTQSHPKTAGKTDPTLQEPPCQTVIREPPVGAPPIQRATASLFGAGPDIALTRAASHIARVRSGARYRVALLRRSPCLSIWIDSNGK
jgi:hypothetical protein